MSIFIVIFGNKICEFGISIQKWRFLFYFITTIKVEVMEQKGFLKGRVGSAGNGQNKPQEIPFFNFNRRILLLISKRV